MTAYDDTLAAILRSCATGPAILGHDDNGRVTVTPATYTEETGLFAFHRWCARESQTIIQPLTETLTCGNHGCGRRATHSVIRFTGPGKPGLLTPACAACLITVICAVFPPPGRQTPSLN